MQKIRLSRLFLIFLTIEILQLWFFSTPPTPPPLPPSDLTTLDSVLHACLKTFAQPAVKPNTPTTQTQAPTPPPKKKFNPCLNGFWDKKQQRCICDMFYLGEFCEIPIIHVCTEDLDRSDVFQNIWENGYWLSGDTKNGPGSTVWYTSTIREFISMILKKYNITSMLDSPCGDFNWMRHTKFPDEFEYVGVDIVRKQMLKLRDDFDDEEKFQFYHSDIVVYPPYKSFDLIFSRDTWQHLSNPDRERILKNYEKSGAKYVLLSYYIGQWDNTDAETGQTRNLNLLHPPYNFPNPIELVIDKPPNTGNGSSTKTVGLWKLPIIREDIVAPKKKINV